MNRILINSLCVVRQCFAVTSLLAVFALMSAETAWAQATMQIINNFNSSTPHAAKYFSRNYSDDQVWLYFLNTNGSVTYTNTHNAQKTVQDATSIQLSTVKDGKFNLGIGGVSTKVFAGLGPTTPFSGDNGPGVFDENVPYALAEWTINGNQYDNTDVSYEDTLSFPTQMTVKNGGTHRATFQSGTQAEYVINALKAVMPNKPVGPHNDNYPTPGSLVGWGPLVPTVSGHENANRWIGSSKYWISGPDSNNLRSMYIYAPSLNDYLRYLKDNETSQFNNGITGWYIDYSGNGGYSGYLSITGSDQNYSLSIHNIRVNTNGSAPYWKADPTAGNTTTGEITVTANNATIPYYPSDGTNIIGLWTDGVIYSGAALLDDFWDGPVVTGTGDFATSGAQKAIVPTMLASISASIATGLLGSEMYKDKIEDSTPGATMYWFNTLTRAQSTQKLFEKAWSQGQKFYDPFWKTMAEFTNMQGYLSPFNDRWANFSPDFTLSAGSTITWELGITFEETQDIPVQANQPWQDTGIDVQAGTVVLTYQSGLWTADPSTNNGNLYDAAGCPGITVTQPGYPLQNVNMGALVGKIGSNPVFLIGNGPTTTPSGQSGELKLCINDDLEGLYGAGLTDNSGSVTVQKEGW